MSRNQERFRYKVITQHDREPPRLISRHHQRGRADRRLLRLPLRPGETVAIYEDGAIVRTVRCPGPGDRPEIPF
jgi:hypothetical protein